MRLVKSLDPALANSITNQGWKMMKENEDDKLKAKAIEILLGLKKKGCTLEQISRSLGDPDRGYGGPSCWSVQRWLAGTNGISKGSAARVMTVYGKK